MSEREEILGPLPATHELMAALAKAQAEMDNAPMNSENPHFRSKYADLASIRNATIPALSKHGLSLHQVTRIDGSGMVLVTRLGHASGQFIDSVYPLPNSNKPHEMGSAITYARRYSWAAICGIAAEEDEDGNAAQEGAKNGKPLPALPARKSSAAAKRDGDWEKFKAALADCQSAREVERLRAEYQAHQYHAWNVDWRDVAEETFEKRLAEFSGADLKQTLQDSLEDPEQARVRIRDQMIEEIQKMTTEEDLLVWKESPSFRSELDALPRPMQLAVRKAGATKLETLQRAGAIMSRALVVLWNAADREKVARWASKAPPGTRVEFKATKRSLPANDRLWAMLTEVAAQVPWHGVKLSAADYKLIFLDALKKELRIVPNLDGDGFVNLGRSSSDLSKEEFSDLLALIEAWGAKHHVQFNDPKEAAA